MVLATSLAVSRLRCLSVVLTGGWVLKLGLQWIDPGRDLRLAVQRQSEMARVCPRLYLGVHRMEPDSATEAPLLMHKNGGAGPHQNMLTVGTALPLWALGMHKHHGLSTHRGKAEIYVDPQELEPHDFRSRAEIWAVSCRLWKTYAIGSFVSSEPVRHSSRLLVVPGLGGSGSSSCQNKQRQGERLDWPLRSHSGAWCLTSGSVPAYLCWCTGEHSAWGTSGLIACTLMMRKGRGQCQQEHTHEWDHISH